MPEPANNELLKRARAGDQDALGELLKAQNRLLEQMARKEVDGRLQARLSAADIVQQTCLSAIRNFDDFKGDNEPQFAAWLRGVHDRNVKDVVRKHVVAKKRAVSAQLPLDNRTLQNDSPHTPSRRAMLDESTAQLTQALDSLLKLRRKRCVCATWSSFRSVKLLSRTRTQSCVAKDDCLWTKICRS